MADFRKLAAAALAAGLLAGLFLSLLQHFLTEPLLFAAESLETPEPGHAGDWQPADGWQRAGFTALFNCLSGFGYALLLCAGMYWQGRAGCKRGFLWGLAGFAVFFGAPALGLPPELPGTDSAALYNRQVWWLFTAAATALGLAGLFLSGQNRWQLGGALLLAAPHLIGAPQPEIAFSTAPEALQQRFVLLAGACYALFWPSLGALSGWLLAKFEPSA